MPLNIRVDRKEPVICYNTQCSACDECTMMCKLGQKCADHQKELKLCGDTTEASQK